MPTPSDLKPYRRHAEWALVAATAQELGVYDALADGAAGLDGLAERLSLHPRGLAVVMGVLEEMGFVRRDPDGAYRLTGSGRGHVVDADTLDYQGDALRLWLHNVREWAGSLPSSVRTGEPAPDAPGGREVSEEEALERFQAAMANKNPRLVEAVVDACLERAPSGGRVLDLGGGPGTFARAFVERGREVVLFDTPQVVEHVSGAYGLAGIPEIELVGGDFLETLPEGPFQVVLLANITHIFDAETNHRLLERAADTLAPGGVLAVMDFVRGVEPFAALFAVTMLLNTEEGSTYTLQRYEAWLEAAGLVAVRCRTVPEERQVVTALKPPDERDGGPWRR